MIDFTIPGDAPSTPNLREHHFARAKRVKAQRAAVARRMPKWLEGPLLNVRLTRVAPRALDGDNMQGAMKSYRDAVAARLRIDDATPLVAWAYHQVSGEAEVVVQIWRTGEKAPPSPEGRLVERKRGKADTVKGQRCHKNGCRKPRPCADHDGTMKPTPRPAYEPPRTPSGMGMHLHEQDSPGPIRRAAEHRAMLAAQEAEATFAPAPVPPCENCGEQYRPKCFDPKAPPGTVACRKDVHCYRYDGHAGDCSAISPRECAT